MTQTEIKPKKKHSDLSLVTMAAASIGSLVATVVIGRFGFAGTLAGAALTPIVVALGGELVRRPARRLPDIQELGARAFRQAAERGDDAEGDERGGPAGAEPRPPLVDVAALKQRLARVRWRRVLVIGIAAFALVVAGFTFAELAGGKSALANRKLTFIPSQPVTSTTTPTPSQQPSQQASNQPSPTASPTPSASPSPSESATSTPSATPSPAQTSSPSAGPTVPPSAPAAAPSPSGG